MLTAYSRVTVVTGERTIDLALPSALPLSDVLPQVMRFASPEHQAGAPTSWTLARLGAASLPLTQSLAEAGVLDGDVLELRGQQEDVRPALVEDVRDAVEDSVDDAGGVWSTRTTGSFAVLAGASLLGVLALASLTGRLFGSPSWTTQVDTPGAATAAIVGLLFATWWAARFARPVDAAGAALSAMLWGALLGRAVVADLDVEPWTDLASTVLGLALVAGVAVLLTRAAIGHAAAAAVLLAAGLLHAVVGWLDLPVEQAVRVLPVLALLTVGVSPRVSLSVGGLASADYRVRHVGRLDLSVLRARYRASNALLVGSLVGVAVVVVWGSIVLDLRGDEWDQTLALSLAVAALLRSRLFSRTQHMLPLRVAGLVVLGFALTRYAVDHADLVAWLAPIGALCLVAAISVAGVPVSEITRARVKRTLNIIEFLVIVDLLVVLAGSMGVYSALGGIF
ncbi:MAG: type VII secretion integral membrane protein EccD [Aeromicrobium sp.]